MHTILHDAFLFELDGLFGGSKGDLEFDALPTFIKGETFLYLMQATNEVLSKEGVILEKGKMPYFVDNSGKYVPLDFKSRVGYAKVPRSRKPVHFSVSKNGLECDGPVAKAASKQEEAERKGKDPLIMRGKVKRVSHKETDLKYVRNIHTNMMNLLEQSKKTVGKYIPAQMENDIHMFMRIEGHKF